jgi:hypothetical protein
VPECDTAARKVVGRDFERNPVTREHADAEAAHLSGDCRMDFVSIRDKHAECRVRENFGYSPFELDCFFFRHKTPCSDVFDVVKERGHSGVNQSGPVLVTLCREA